jgi:XRE family transcriptional regulator, regulator of sulfur utilization
VEDRRSNRDVFSQRFTENLRRARRLGMISQETLGIRAGLHRTEIGKLENAERIPRLDTAVKLATALEIPLDQLVDGLTWEPSRRLDETGRFTSRRPTPTQRHRSR